MSYLDCLKLMDRALENTKGVRIAFNDMGAARHYRTRLHTARTIVRQDNTSVYDTDHPMHGRSIYDPLVVREPREEDGKIWLYIEKISIEKLEIQPLGEDEPLSVEYSEPQALPPPEPPKEEITVFDTPKVARRV